MNIVYQDWNKMKYEDLLMQFNMEVLKEKIELADWIEIAKKIEIAEDKEIINWGYRYFLIQAMFYKLLKKDDVNLEGIEKIINDKEKEILISALLFAIIQQTFDGQNGEDEDKYEYLIEIYGNIQKKYNDEMCITNERQPSIKVVDYDTLREDVKYYLLTLMNKYKDIDKIEYLYIQKVLLNK